MKDTKFIRWFAFYNEQSPSVRYRGKYPLEHLRKNHGIDHHLLVPGYSPKRVVSLIGAYMRALFRSSNNSLVVIQRVRSNFIYANLLKFLALLRSNTVYDLDDADHLEHSPDSIRFFAKHCTTMMVGSTELCFTYRSLNRRIILQTSPVPHRQFTKGKRNARFSIGWIGCFGGGHKSSLYDLAFPAITRLEFELDLVLLGVDRTEEELELIEYFSAYPLVRLVIAKNIDWTDEVDVQSRIVQFDVGIATLLDDELHRSKSAFKSKQYMNNGIPVVSSDLPENNNFVVHNKNGFLCSTEEEFHASFTALKEMDDLEYLKFSENALTASEGFDLDHYCSGLVRLTNGHPSS